MDLRDYGAIGDGEVDDGPALQSALNALATSGGGTLLVPAGRYAIITPVEKDFTGLALSITIQGVASSTTVAPPTAPGPQLTRGLDLVSEFAPKTGSQNAAITITGLQEFSIKDIAFIGTPTVTDDALVTLNLRDIGEALIRHCEFYGLSSLVRGGSIVQSVRSRLSIDQTIFLGSTASSAVNSPIVQNLEWKGLTISDSLFADYGQRPELFGKMNYGAPLSWVNLGNAAVVTPDSPRREATLRNVFLDEGGYIGVTNLPHFYEPTSAPIDLIYITGLFMNVSNLGTLGHYLVNAQNVLIEDSHYGWSHNNDAAIDLVGVGNAILDKVECIQDADTIRADGATGKLTVINSIYDQLESQAQTTEVINVAPENDPVRLVRQRFIDQLGRGPDAAAHFYWSNQLLQCNQELECVANRQAALNAYLDRAPQPLFAINGRVVDESGARMTAVTVRLSGSQQIVTQTDGDGKYRFSGLPTSGAYIVTPTLNHHTLSPASLSIVTPASDLVADFSGAFNHYDISGHVANAAGNPLSSVTVALSGSESATVTTDDDGSYVFPNLPADGSYTVTVRKTSYAFTPPVKTYETLSADQTLDFTGTFVTYTISGRVVNVNNAGIAGVKLTLSGSQSGTTTSDSDGNFRFTGIPSEGHYTVEPSRIGLAFSPQSVTYSSLASDKLAHFSAASSSYIIMGRVTGSQGGGIAGATVTLSGHASGTFTTDTNGNYVISELPRGANFTVTVSHMHYTFTHSSRTFNNLTANQQSDFNGVLHTHTLSGRVTAGGSGLAGVAVTLSGSQNATLTTAADGNYSFTNLPAGGNFTVAVAKLGSAFGPAKVSFNNLSGNQVADFIETGPAPVLIVEENTQCATALRSVTWMRDPFSPLTNLNFSSDQHTRIMLFAMNLKLQPGEDASAVTVQMEDAQHRLYNLPVEFVGQVPGFNWLSQVVVKLTDQIVGVGDCQVSIVYRSNVSNKALIKLK